MSLDVERLRKVVAMLDSPATGEAEAARTRATAMLRAAGKRWADLPAILGTNAAAPRAPSSGFTDIFADIDDRMEARAPGYKARAAAERAAKTREQAAYRAATIARYGSEEAVLALTPMEAAVEAAVAPFIRKKMHQYANGRFPRTTLDGWVPEAETVPEHVAAAVRAALPMPRTIAEAKAEYDAWHERDRERQAIRDHGDSALPLGCYLRQQIVGDLLHHELRAASLADAIVRHRAIADSGMAPDAEEADAMLADLEHLAELERQRDRPDKPVQSGRPGTTASTATARRAEVQRILSTLDGVALPDREIARRVGVSPQTVGNIRRRMG